jgi:hypothetical protein
MPVEGQRGSLIVDSVEVERGYGETAHSALVIKWVFITDPCSLT